MTAVRTNNLFIAWGGRTLIWRVYKGYLGYIKSYTEILGVYYGITPMS